MLPSEKYRQPSAGAVLGALHEITERHGYLQAEAVVEAATDLGIPLSQIFSAATFYSSFSHTPPGQHKLQVCEGTACYVRGAAELLENLIAELGVQPDETTQDLLFTLKSVRCVGSCGLAPVVRVGEKTYGRLEPADLMEILEMYRSDKQIEVDQ
ncbi:MAG TPA: NAD(P)H-dependent oxidoreductase subunit E [candidate division Zixibacteria bacterium]|nr:NAD(P)H-dependent oxidoreductase subunit E [candidate division Zixibacteria bacterium]